MKAYCHSMHGPIKQDLKKFPDSRLAAVERTLLYRLQDIQKFVHWPALEFSLSADLEAIWAEQRLRSELAKTKAKHKADIEHAALTPYSVNSLQDLFTK